MPTPISRRYRVQEKRSTRKGLYFIIAAIVLFVLFLNYGIPLAGQLAGIIGSSKSALNDAPVNDIAPVSPQLDSPVQFTSENTITLTGRAESGSTLKVYRNEENIKSTVVDSSGSFSINIDLLEGENKIWTTSSNENKTEGEKSREFIVTYDNTPPKLEITKPVDGESIYGTNNKTITVEGQSEKDTRITVNDRIAIVSASGSFSTKLSLNEGANEIIIISKDQAENTTEKKITVSFSP